MKLLTFLAAFLLLVACGDDKELSNDYQARPESTNMDFFGGCPPKQDCPDQKPCPKCPDQKPDQKPKNPDQNFPPDPKPPEQKPNPKDPDQNFPPDPKPPKQDPDQKPDQKPPKQDPDQKPDQKPPKQDPDQKTCICQTSRAIALVVPTSTNNRGDWCQEVDSGAWYFVNTCNI